MINIGIYNRDSVQKKEIKRDLKKYFDDLKIQSDISSIRTKFIAHKNLEDKYCEYNIILLCKENKITYIRRNLVNHLKNYGSQTIGWIDYPLNVEKIDKIIFNEDYHNCPRGIYELNTKETLRVVSHGDIEYCQIINRKTIIYLKDNETEETNDSIKTLKSKLSEVYFVECLKGFIVNLYNVKKIDRVNHFLFMNSGCKIPISKSKYKDVIRLFISVMFGI